MDSDTTDKLGDHAERAEKHRRWSFARKPKQLGSVLAQVIAKRGYAAVQAGESLQQAWQSAAGEALSVHTRAVGVSRGKLEVLVASSPMMQEIQFQQQQLLNKLRQALPEARLTGLKLRVGRLN